MSHRFLQNKLFQVEKVENKIFWYYSKWFEPWSISTLYALGPGESSSEKKLLLVTQVTNSSSFQNYSHPDGHNIRNIWYCAH